MLKEVIEKNINNNYKIASAEIGISELILKEFLNGNAKLIIYDMDKILNTLGIKIDNSQGKRIETSLIVREEEKKDKFKYFAAYWLAKKNLK
jgi:hypothetical protein